MDTFVLLQLLNGLEQFFLFIFLLFFSFLLLLADMLWLQPGLFASLFLIVRQFQLLSRGVTY